MPARATARAATQPGGPGVFEVLIPGVEWPDEPGPRRSYEGGETRAGIDA